MLAAIWPSTLLLSTSSRIELVFLVFSLLELTIFVFECLLVGGVLDFLLLSGVDPLLSPLLERALRSSCICFFLEYPSDDLLDLLTFLGFSLGVFSSVLQSPPMLSMTNLSFFVTSMSSIAFSCRISIGLLVANSLSSFWLFLLLLLLDLDTFSPPFRLLVFISFLFSFFVLSTRANLTDLLERDDFPGPFSSSLLFRLLLGISCG
uniref:Uncharacterized protein n=1 Tax=Cacopsylla melanoneura TaxID=428564 RepID=A0A8D8WKG0_9HEMI